MQSSVLLMPSLLICSGSKGSSRHNLNCVYNNNKKNRINYGSVIMCSSKNYSSKKNGSDGGEIGKPKHVAIILDGHGRWAEDRGIPVQQGHEAGVANFKQLIYHAATSISTIKAFTVFAFSTQNWSRPKAEVDFLFTLFQDFISTYIMELIEQHDLRFCAIGDKLRLPPSLQSVISVAEECSHKNKGMQFVMAMSYSGKYDICEAAKNIATEVEAGKLRPQDINEEVFEQQLLTNNINIPNPDLVIRMSGEVRISNFLLWQLAYSEFYFVDKMFPDFSIHDLTHALTCFHSRKRRFGLRKSA